jgi:membrane protein
VRTDQGSRQPWIFHETTAASTSGKFTFGLIATIWSASVGISAIQDTLNAVYKVQETRSYFKARLAAIGVTILLTALVSLCLAALLGADFFAALARHHLRNPLLTVAAVIASRLIGWTMATIFLTLSFAVIYYWAPAVKTRRWHWLTVGGAVGIYLLYLRLHMRAA